MSLFSNILGAKLKPFWEFTTQGTLWRMLVSDGGLFVGEDRDTETKRVSFFCVEHETGKILWRNVQFQEQWWIGIETIHKGVVFFHEFASPDMPGHKKIFTSEISTGKILWSNEELEFLFAHEGCVYATKIEYGLRQFYELDLYTGAVLRSLDGQYMDVLRETIPPKAENVEFPLAFNFSANEHTELQQRIEKAIAQSRNVQSVEYMQKNNKLIVSWHDNMSDVPDQPMLNNEIVIMGESSPKVAGKVIYKDIISVNTVMPVPDTFFGKGNFVYYIKDKKSLVALKIENL